MGAAPREEQHSETTLADTKTAYIVYSSMRTRGGSGGASILASTHAGADAEKKEGKKNCVHSVREKKKTAYIVHSSMRTRGGEAAREGQPAHTRAAGADAKKKEKNFVYII